MSSNSGIPVPIEPSLDITLVSIVLTARILSGVPSSAGCGTATEEAGFPLILVSIEGECG